MNKWQNFVFHFDVFSGNGPESADRSRHQTDCISSNETRMVIFDCVNCGWRRSLALIIVNEFMNSKRYRCDASGEKSIQIANERKFVILIEMYFFTMCAQAHVYQLKLWFCLVVLLGGAQGFDVGFVCFWVCVCVGVCVYLSNHQVLHTTTSLRVHTDRVPHIILYELKDFQSQRLQYAPLVAFHFVSWKCDEKKKNCKWSKHQFTFFYTIGWAFEIACATNDFNQK